MITANSYPVRTHGTIVNYNVDTFAFVIKLTKLTVITFVSIGPGAMALNLIPYFPHSAASDLKMNIYLECHFQPPPG